MVFYAGSWGESIRICKVLCEAMVVESGCRLVAGGVLLCGSTWKPYQRELSGVVFLMRQYFSIAHEKSQEGSKGGNGFFHLRWVLPVVGSKAIVDHFRLVRLQADGEGESGALMDKFFNTKAPDSPSPFGKRQDPYLQ
jgi:hypothetical protein